MCGGVRSGGDGSDGGGGKGNRRVSANNIFQRSLPVHDADHGDAPA